jgi:Phytanoyl-CoA dioxygenase (PhyH)
MLPLQVPTLLVTALHLYLLSTQSEDVSGFSSRCISRSSPLLPRHKHELSMVASSSDAARDMLYQDQQQAMLRRSLVEADLLAPQTSLLRAPKLKAETPRGTGFAASQKSSKGARLAVQQAKTIQKEGVLLMENVMTTETAELLRAFVLEQQQVARDATTLDPTKARSFYGVEQARAHRCDLQLSLLRGGYKADHSEAGEHLNDSHILADALEELFGDEGTLVDLYKALVTPRGELYELAAVVTHPGSQRQIVHPDLPFQKLAPLFVVFLALQDVSEDMGPTSFLLRTHTEAQNNLFTSGDTSIKNAQLSAADCRISCLKKGDAVVFDARVLHCGNANASADKARALFNLSFRNPQVVGSLGYEGSIRPGYVQQMTMSALEDALASYKLGNLDPFKQYGSGILL